MAIDPKQIKDAKLRARIAAADAAQNGIDRHALTCASLASHGVKVKGKVMRVRQDPKPLMNKLEAEFFGILALQQPYEYIRVQAKRYRLGNGIWYKPDFTCSNWPDGDERVETAWEVKGPRAFRGGFENLKVAASLYPEVRWLLVWKDKTTGEWQGQHILP